MSNKESVGGEQAYQHTIDEAIADEEERYAKFLKTVMEHEVETDE